MVLFNRLFGRKKRIAKELQRDAGQRIKLWEEHLANYPKREALAKQLSPGSPANPILANTMRDPIALENLLVDIRRLISEELVHIRDEKMLDKEILADLKKLLNSGHETEELHRTIAEEVPREKTLRKVFKKYYAVLRTELHLIHWVLAQLSSAEPNQTEMRERLVALFRLTFHQEAYLWKIFQDTGFRDPTIRDTVRTLARAILREEEIQEEFNAVEERFVKAMLKGMANTESKGGYRRLAEEIFHVLLERVGAPFGGADDPDAEAEQGFARFNRLVERDAALATIIRAKRPQYSDEQVRAAVRAFRKAYEQMHFDSLEGEFWT